AGFRCEDVRPAKQQVPTAGRAERDRPVARRRGQRASELGPDPRSERLRARAEGLRAADAPRSGRSKSLPLPWDRRAAGRGCKVRDRRLQAVPHSRSDRPERVAGEAADRPPRTAAERKLAAPAERLRYPAAAT